MGAARPDPGPPPDHRAGDPDRAAGSPWHTRPSAAPAKPPSATSRNENCAPWPTPPCHHADAARASPRPTWRRSPPGHATRWRARSTGTGSLTLPPPCRSGHPSRAPPSGRSGRRHHRAPRLPAPAVPGSGPAARPRRADRGHRPPHRPVRRRPGRADHPHPATGRAPGPVVYLVPAPARSLRPLLGGTTATAGHGADRASDRDTAPGGPRSRRTRPGRSRGHPQRSHASRQQHRHGQRAGQHRTWHQAPQWRCPAAGRPSQPDRRTSCRQHSL